MLLLCVLVVVLGAFIALYDFIAPLVSSLRYIVVRRVLSIITRVLLELRSVV